MDDIDFIYMIEIIKELLGVKNQESLAKKLGVKPQAVSAAKRRKSVPDPWFEKIQISTGKTKDDVYRLARERLSRGVNQVKAYFEREHQALRSDPSNSESAPTITDSPVLPSPELLELWRKARERSLPGVERVTAAEPPPAANTGGDIARELSALIAERLANQDMDTQIAIRARVKAALEGGAASMPDFAAPLKRGDKSEGDAHGGEATPPVS